MLPYSPYHRRCHASSLIRRDAIPLTDKAFSVERGGLSSYLLSIVTRNWRNLLLVLANLPFALVGGVLAVFATGGMLSLGSMVGFVTLFGITLRNSIMMVSHYEHLVEVEGRRWGAETAIEGAADRLVPILMTSLVTALGLLPLAIGMGDVGGGENPRLDGAGSLL